MEPTKNREFNLSLTSSSCAPWYHIPRKSIVSVEHPFIIQNIDKGVESLGGVAKLQAVSCSLVSTSDADFLLVG